MVILVNRRHPQMLSTVLIDDGSVVPGKVAMETSILEDGPSTPDRCASAEVVSPADAEPEPVLEPLCPSLIVSPPVVTSRATNSAAFAWPVAGVTFQDHDERQAQLQQLCQYATSYQLQLQHVNIASTASTPEALHAAAEAQVEDRAWWTATTTAGTEARVEGLRPGRFYVARVLVVATVQVSDGSSSSFPAVSSSWVVLRTVPTPPGVMTPPTLAQRARNALKLKWGLPDETGGEEIAAFTLQMQPAPPGWEGMPDAQGFYEIYSGLERSWKVAKLAPGSRFTFRIKCRNVLGEGPWSLHSVFTTQPSVPLQPEPPRVVLCTQDSATLEWDAPHDCGSPISSYSLERDDGHGGQFSTVAYCGPLRRAVANKLAAGLTYRYRLRAENGEGYSLWSEVSSGSTAAVKPGCPRGLCAVGASTTSATLRWQPPAHDGGSPTTSYQVQLQAKTRVATQQLGGEWVVIYSGSSTATTFSALQPGCQYMARVAAINSAGQGQFCVPVQLTTAPDVPVVPEPPVAKPSTTSLVLEWGPPPHDGGSPLTSYRVEMRCSPNHSQEHVDGLHPEQTLALMPHFLTIYSGLETCVQVTDLLPGTTYEFQLQAHNSCGASPWSKVGAATTLPAAPMAPSAPAASATSSSSVALTWAAPYHQGSPVTSYTVNMLRLGSTSSTSITSSSNCNGAAGSRLLLTGSNPSSVRGSSTGGSVRGGTSESGHSSGDEDAGVASSNGHMEDPQLRAAQRRRARWETVYTGPALSCEVKNLEPAHQYGFRVRAHNSQGGSEWGPATMATTAAAAPGGPGDLVASAVSSSEVQLAWQPPKHDNGAVVSSYIVEMQQLGRTASSTAVKAAVKNQDGWVREWQGSECQHRVEGLTPGRYYCWRVRAGNSQGWGPWGEAAVGCPAPAVPSVPLHLTCTGRTSGSLKLKWGLPSEEHGAAVVRYVLQVQPAGGEWQQAYSGSDTSTKVEGLQPGMQYQVRVAAVNSVGQGSWSEPEAAATALRAPEVPTQLQAQVGGSSAGQLLLEVSWAAPGPRPQCAEVVGYEVEAAPASSSSSQVLKQNVRHCSTQLAGALHSRTYTVRCRAVGAAGAGHSSWSQGVAVTTPEAPKPAAAAAANSAAMNGHGSSAAGGSPASADAAAAGKKSKKSKRSAKEANGLHGEAAAPAAAAQQSARGVAAVRSWVKQGEAAKRPPKQKTLRQQLQGLYKQYCTMVYSVLALSFLVWLIKAHFSTA